MSRGNDDPMIRELPAKRRRWAILLALFVLAFAVRLGTMIATSSYDFGSDYKFGFEFGITAKWVAAGEGFQFAYEGPPEPSAYMAPVYVYFMALIFIWFGTYSVTSAIVIIIIQSLTAAATCPVLFAIGNRIWNDLTGYVAALLFALYPPSVFFATHRIGPVSLVVLLVAVIILYMLKMADDPSWRHAVACGLLMGFTALVQPSVIPFYAAACIWLWCASSLSLAVNLRRVVLMAVLTCLCISPWTVRNYVVFDQLVLVKSPLGRNLLKGNNPIGAGIEQLPPGVDPSDNPIRQNDQVNEIERDDLMLQKALAFIQDHPMVFLANTLHRFYTFWSPIHSERQLRLSQVVLRVTTYGSILILSIIGLSYYRRRQPWRQLSLLLGFLLTYPLIYYVTHVTYYRYVYPVEFVLILIAASTLVFFAARYAGRLGLDPDRMLATAAVRSGA